eukprot:gene10804-10960_t
MTETAAPPGEQVAHYPNTKLTKNKKKTRKKRKKDDDAVDDVEAASCALVSKRLRRSCGSVAAGPGGVVHGGPGAAGPSLSADEAWVASTPHQAVQQAVQQAAEPSRAAVGVHHEGCHDGRTWHSHVFWGERCFTVDKPCLACAVPSGLVAAAFTTPPGTSSFKVELTVLKDGQAVEVSGAAGDAAGGVSVFACIG